MSDLRSIKKIDRLLSAISPPGGAPPQTDAALLEEYTGLVDREELLAYLRQQPEREKWLTEQPAPAEAAVNPFAQIDTGRLREIIGREHSIISRGAKMELARRDFFCFCHLLAPSFYKPERAFLVKLCRELQAFFEAPDETIMIINLPPRHGKSRTAGLFAMWAFGKNPRVKIMTGSYNETLSTMFSKTVRNGIQELKADSKTLVYRDIFPDIAIKQGDAAMNLWSLEGQYASYLATSPGGTATGFGASLIIIDDLIKSAGEAFNDELLENQKKWFTDTMFSRLEEGGKIMIIMTRWARGDLAGWAKEHFGEQGMPVREVVMRAVQEDGTMLCPQILSRGAYEMKLHAMSEEIASANYQQIPVDIKGRLYVSLKTYAALPTDEKGRISHSGTYNYTDTADEGADYLCSISYMVFGDEAYIVDVLYTQAGMEVTEPATAEMLAGGRVDVCDIESNNGGRGFARNVQAELRKRGARHCVVRWFHQSANKRSRILVNSAWVMEHVYFPANWRERWPEFYRDLNKYQKAGKNAHDDAPDALTGVAEHFTKPQHQVKVGKRRFGL